MLGWLCNLVGIDEAQWRALTGTALKLDFRVARFGGGAFGRQGGTGGRAASSLFFYLLMGVGLAGVVVVLRDPFLSGVVVLTLIMFMIGSILLMDHQSVITSPDDYDVLGFRPVSSRTYFMVRLTNVLVYTSVLATAFGLPSVVAYGVFVQGFNPWLGAAALLAVYGTSLTTVLAILVLYAALIRAVAPDRLKRALTYLQVVLAFVVYGGFAFMGPLMGDLAPQLGTLEKTPWLFIHPATWFASYLDLAVGRFGLAEVGPALLSVVVLAAIAASVFGRLSLDYAERLGSMVAASEPRQATTVTSSASRDGWWGSRWFGRREARVVALLIRAQFKHDQKFRLAVLGILPMTLIYLFLGLRGGELSDPFVAQGRETSQAAILYLAVLLFPVMLKVGLARSDAYRASWIFHICPADQPRLVLSMKWLLMAYFMLPYLGLMAAIFGYYFRNPIHVTVHLLVLGLLSHLFLQMAVLLDPDLPFSQPIRKGERSAVMFVTMIVLAFVSVPAIVVISRWIYPSWRLTAATILGLIAVSMVIERLVVTRVTRLSARWEYVG